jgi:hypothetical protein
MSFILNTSVRLESRKAKIQKKRSSVLNTFHRIYATLNKNCLLKSSTSAEVFVWHLIIMVYDIEAAIDANAFPQTIKNIYLQKMHRRFFAPILKVSRSLVDFSL